MKRKDNCLKTRINLLNKIKDLEVSVSTGGLYYCLPNIIAVIEKSENPAVSFVITELIV